MKKELDQYQALLVRIDSLFGEIRHRHQDAMHCRMGCHSCCKPELTVGPLEAENIREGLFDNPTLVAELLSLEKENPHRGKRCSFLSAEGACRIYELRPLVCRSHGVPLQFKDPAAGGKEDAARLRDVCPLNFTGEDIGRLEARDVMNLDTLNTLLALLSQMAYGKNQTRTALKASALLEL